MPVVLFGPVPLALAGLVAVVGWSRVRLGDHSTAQVLAGTVAGVLVAAPTFLLLAGRYGGWAAPVAGTTHPVPQRPAG
ncbi:phosphatase PAP2 family protein [Micromonospora sp. KC723]|uniref:phosphatase PAP2 family protein n=1 Tax=Micromonospora sp. KC723 TaxID=2530381 RepID=UPI00104FE845|nr:phosphatase PAP2 family protein [Micromonospora sp. KC723]TDB70239.1 phosphatase PAP2 family protein [Micromonospora sp. KC723]